MPTKREQFTVYPQPRVRPLVAWSAGAANSALARYADMIGRADLSALKPADWSLLADVLNGKLVDTSWRPEDLEAELADADRLDGIGQKWFGREAAQEMRRLTDAVAVLRQIQFWAVVTAVEWFWAHHEEIRVKRDRWWTPEFRAAHGRATAR